MGSARVEMRVQPAETKIRNKLDGRRLSPDLAFILQLTPCLGAGDHGTGDFPMRSMPWLGLSLTAVFLLLFCGCGATGSTPAPLAPAPLSAANINLIFVVSEDLTNNAAGDVNASTANLTSQGLQRTLLMAPFLQQNVLGGNNVTVLYALEPMTHLQTAKQYPDMVALETVQQFALLNQITMSSNGEGLNQITGYSYPINASYVAGSLPSGVAPLPLPATPSYACPGCQGLDFADAGSDNEILLSGIVQADAPGFYVFSAPWETTSSLLASINRLEGYNLTLPASYISPNYIYAIAIAPSERSASLITYNSDVNPLSTYPELPPPAIVPTPCATPAFSIAVTDGVDGAHLPKGINTNETLYMIRHANAHPTAYFADGNYVGAGQWRALDLPNALTGKIDPAQLSQVYSLDPAQVAIGTYNSSGDTNFSHLTPALTVEPYAIANNLPYNLAASFLMSDADAPKETSDFFFTNPQFSGQTFLMAWEHSEISLTVNYLLSSYGSTQVAPAWPNNDYDTIWTVKLDAVGNLTVNNTMCEGINSATLPATAPQF
jgi:hypothetical protein